MLKEIPTSEVFQEGCEHAFLGPTTAGYYRGDMRQSDIDQLTSRLADDPEVLSDIRCCMIIGYGGQKSATYHYLKHINGIEVIKEANWGPWWLTPLFIIAASRGGLIRVHDKQLIPDVFTRLSNCAVAELYSFNRNLTNDVKDHVQRNKWRSQIGEVIREDDGYFCFGVDGDTFCTDTGIIGWCAFGKQCPPSLINIVQQL
jgi:hypothetical protein